MPFSFLNPLFWLGLFALTAPVWLHLRRKRQTNLVRFSAVRFLEDQPEPKRSPLRPRDLLLLLLRALALVLIISAFAWPFLHNLNTVPVQESRVYILDNTLSHQANKGFTAARDHLLKELARTPADRQVAVIELASSPRVAVAFGDSHETALENIRRLQPSFERGSYLAAFRQANALLANSLGLEKRIVFLGDNQANQWNENVSTPPFLRHVQVDMPKTPTEPLPNLSLSDARVQRVFLGEKSLVNFTVKLSHSGPAKAAKLSLLVNGEQVADRSVTLENQPETILLQAQWEADPAAALQGEVSIEADAEADALPPDNRLFFSLPAVVEGKVALLAQSPYLRVALSPDIMRGEWNTRILEPTRLGAELDANNDAEVLCIESAYLQSSDARKLLARYLSNGRGVLLLVNRSSPAIDGCLRELGFEPEGTVVAEEDEPDKFQFVFSNHPIFHPFLSPDYGNLMEIKIAQHVRIKTTQGIPLAFSDHGTGLFFQGTKTEGKLFVCAFGLDRDHSSWPIHQTFIPFLDLALQAARAVDTTPSSFEPAEAANFQFAPSVTAREVVLRQGDRELARLPLEQGKARIRIPDHPGHYALTLDEQKHAEKIFCVNPSPKESALSFADAAQAMKTWQMAPGKELARPVAATAQFRLAGVLQQHWWWWMVSAGLLLLLLETVWAAAKKDTT